MASKRDHTDGTGPPDTAIRRVDESYANVPVASAMVPEVAGAQLLGRGLQVLFLLRETGAPMSVADLAEALALPISNVYRLTQQLELAGLVDRPARGELTLGLRFLDFASAVQDWVNEEIVTDALPVMQALTAETGESSLLTKRTGLSAVGVISVDSPRPIRLSFKPGRVMPLYRGASGRILLAWMNPRLLTHVLKDMQPYESDLGQPVGSDDIEQILRGIRAAGYCVTRGDVDADATAVAAPIFVQPGRLFAGLTLAGQHRSFSEDRLPYLIDRVRTAADEIGSLYASRFGSAD
jgi:IclR family transcriptional regulator, acetate operon repressor